VTLNFLLKTYLVSSIRKKKVQLFTLFNDVIYKLPVSLNGASEALVKETKVKKNYVKMIFLKKNFKVLNALLSK
jgi:hypothetical protein